MQLAAEVVKTLDMVDSTAKRIIVTNLRDLYNSGWNEYDEVQEDGSLRAVSNPQLSESEFEAQFTMVAINITGTDGVDLFYQDGGLFWGHSVIVSSESADFSNAYAELFG